MKCCECVKFNKREDSAFGECRARPPVVFDDMPARWPVVAGDAWCMEYKGVARRMWTTTLVDENGRVTVSNEYV